MPASVKGGVELRKALRQFTPDLAKETQKELGAILKPITAKARGFIPSTAPLSGWANSNQNGAWGNRVWSSSAAKRGIGYKTTPSKVNRSGFRSLARIVNASAAGAIYETAGRKNPRGTSPQGAAFIKGIARESGMIVRGKQGRVAYKAVQDREPYTLNEIRDAINKGQAALNRKLAN